MLNIALFTMIIGCNKYQTYNVIVLLFFLVFGAGLIFFNLDATVYQQSCQNSIKSCSIVQLIDNMWGAYKWKVWNYLKCNGQVMEQPTAGSLIDRYFYAEYARGALDL